MVKPPTYLVGFRGNVCNHDLITLDGIDVVTNPEVKVKQIHSLVGFNPTALNLFLPSIPFALNVNLNLIPDFNLCVRLLFLV